MKTEAQKEQELRRKLERKRWLKLNRENMKTEAQKEQELRRKLERKLARENAEAERARKKAEAEKARKKDDAKWDTWLLTGAWVSESGDGLPPAGAPGPSPGEKVTGHPEDDSHGESNHVDPEVAKAVKAALREAFASEADEPYRGSPGPDGAALEWLLAAIGPVSRNQDAR